MPYRTRILEVTPFSAVLFPHLRTTLPARLVPGRIRLSALALAICCSASATLQAQPAAVPQASDLDWVSWEQLSEEQKSSINDSCCGMYVEPAFEPLDADPGSSVILGTSVAGGDATLLTISDGLRVIQQDALISANTGTYDQQSRVLTLQDNILIRRRGLLLTGNSAVVDELAARSEIQTASYLLHDSAIRGSAAVIVYTDAQGIITIDNGVFTRCEPGDNSWVIQGAEIELNQSTGRGIARNVTLRVQDIPVMYLPWVSFPINDERASGLLAPILGSTRDGGFDIAAPYYLNLAPNYDATLTPRIQIERGVVLGMEGRYLGRRQEQQLNMQYLPNDHLYDAATFNQPGSDSPPVADRWLLDYDYRARLGGGWSAQMDYAAVSDDEYFQDLGNNGLISNSQSWLRRNARLRYRGSNWNFTATTQAFQIIDPNVSALSEPYRKLPAVNLNGSFETDFGLLYGIDSEFVMFDRNLNGADFSQAQVDNGILVTGSRLALTPTLSLPWSNSYAFATPTVKYKYAAWNLDDQALNRDTSPSRGVASASVDSGLIFERDLDLFGSSLRQTLEPRLFYLYNEFDDQSAIPLFDSSALTFSFNQLFRDDRFSGKDRVGDANQLTLAVSSRIYDESGQEKLRASIGQIQHFSDRRVTLFNATTDAERDATSALAGELSVALGANWRTGSYLEYNTSSNALEVGNFQFQYQSDINRILNLSYRYRDVAGANTSNDVVRRIDQTDISGIWPINADWSLIGRWNFDLANKRNLETIAGVEYNNCCWTVRVLARQWIDNDALFHGIKDNNSGIFIQFELKGLGSVLGGNVNGILNNGISGYRERDYVQ